LADAAALAASAQTGELQHAYGTVTFMKEAGLGIDYWRGELGEQPGAHVASSSTPEPEEFQDDDLENDEELKEILRMSYQEHYGSSPPSGPSKHRPGNKRVKRQSSTITFDDDENKDDNMDLYSLPCPRNRNKPSMKRSLSANDELPASYTGNENSLTEHSTAGQSSQQNNNRSQFLGATTLDQILGRSSLGQRSSTPTSDAIEGDM
jgi:hypothetical protein